MAKKSTRVIELEEVTSAESLERRWLVKLNGSPRGQITRFRPEPHTVHPYKAWSPRGLGGRLLDCFYGVDARERAVNRVLSAN